jgi:hypothetical protein
MGTHKSSNVYKGKVSLFKVVRKFETYTRELPANENTRKLLFV